MSALTHITYDDLDAVWNYPDEPPYPEGEISEADFDTIREEYEEREEA